MEMRAVIRLEHPGLRWSSRCGWATASRVVNAGLLAGNASHGGVRAITGSTFNTSSCPGADAPERRDGHARCWRCGWVDVDGEDLVSIAMLDDYIIAGRRPVISRRLRNARPIAPARLGGWTSAVPGSRPASCSACAQLVYWPSRPKR